MLLPATLCPFGQPCCVRAGDVAAHRVDHPTRCFLSRQLVSAAKLRSCSEFAYTGGTHLTGDFKSPSYHDRTG